MKCDLCSSLWIFVIATESTLYVDHIYLFKIRLLLPVIIRGVVFFSNIYYENFTRGCTKVFRVRNGFAAKLNLEKNFKSLAGKNTNPQIWELWALFIKLQRIEWAPLRLRVREFPVYILKVKTSRADFDFL